MSALPGPQPDELTRTLGSGVATAAVRSLPDDWPYSATDLDTPALRHALTDLYQVRKAKGLTPVAVDERITRLGQELAAHRPLMLAALFSAGSLPAHLPGLAGRVGHDPVDGWMGTCWISQAAWDALHGPLADPAYAPGDRELLVPLAARLRFLAFAEPMRFRAEKNSLWLPADSYADSLPGGPAARVFGTGSWHLLVGRSQEARRVWADCLDAYQSHLFLSSATPGEFEEELRALVFRRRAGRRAQRRPLSLSAQELGQPAPLTAEDRALIEEITERHLLPRFDLPSVTALGMSGTARRGGLARRILGLVAALAGLAAVACAAMLLVHQAMWIAAGCYLLIGAGVAVFGPVWAAPWLLRLPAAAAVGVIALISFLPGRWLSTPPVDWGTAVLAAAALAIAAGGYLLVEARNHGVAGWAPVRALAVAAIGSVHALMVSLIGLVAIAPAFVGNGRGIAALWDNPGHGHARILLLLATAWCLAIGVFSQILWDDRPITAPLAHMAWRGTR